VAEPLTEQPTHEAYRHTVRTELHNGLDKFPNRVRTTSKQDEQTKAWLKSSHSYPSSQMQAHVYKPCEAGCVYLLALLGLALLRS